MVAHELTVTVRPGKITHAVCSCGGWESDGQMLAAPDVEGHRVHVHLAGLNEASAAAHISALADVFNKTDTAIMRMIEAGCTDD
jgi:hypothetical protein